MSMRERESENFGASPDPDYFPVLIDIAARGVFTLVFTVGTMYLHKRTMPKRM